jgi:hypothetical protein
LLLLLLGQLKAADLFWSNCFDRSKSDGPSISDTGLLLHDFLIFLFLVFWCRKYVKRAICAAAIPGNSIGEDVVVGGLANFFQLYNNLLVGRVLLSWFPAAQSSPILQPVFSVCDPYLGLFR